MEISEIVRLDDKTRSYLREMFLPTGYKKNREIVINYNRIKTDINQCNLSRKIKNNEILRKIEQFEVKDIATDTVERLFAKQYSDFKIKFCLNQDIWTSYIITKDIKKLTLYKNLEENNFVIENFYNGNNEYLILLEIHDVLAIIGLKN